MKRREFITVLGGAAAWPLATRAQQSAIPVIGMVVNGPGVPQGFRQGLAESGYVEGQNVRIDVRSANSEYDRLAAIAQELVHQQVAVLVSDAGAPGIIAAKQATTTIPIAFRTGGDPVQLGIVAQFQ